MISSRGDLYLNVDDNTSSELGIKDLQAKKVYSTVDLFDSLTLKTELTV